jgi:hypothetical protein
MRSLYPSHSPSTLSSYPGPVLGSDFPVEPPNPFHGMYAAVTRLNPATGTSPAGERGWHPEEKLSVEQALLGFTRNAGYGWFKEGRIGAIEKGMWADWVVIDRDVGADGDGKWLRDVVVRETWVGGRRVWPRDDGVLGESWAERSCGGIKELGNFVVSWTQGKGRKEL